MLEGWKEPINTFSTQEAMVHLSKTLEICLRIYWGISSDDEGCELVIEKMMGIIWKRYAARLGVKEIELAFELSSLHLLNYEAKIYSKRVTVPHLTDLLDEYLKYRSHIITAYHNALQEQSRQLPAGDVEKQKWQSTIQNIQRLASKGEELHLLFIWYGYYEMLVRKGFLLLSKEEKTEVWEHTKTVVIEDLQVEINEARSLHERSKLSDRLANLRSDAPNDDNKERMKSVAERLAVKQWLLKNREKILSGEFFEGISP